jgi:cytosine/adenosine deaminase-related metal-dependent hydrolase
LDNRTVDLMIAGGHVVTVDRDNRVFPDGAVAVKASRIVDVGPTEDLVSRYAADRTIDAQGKLIAPGLIETYHHAGHGLMKGIYRVGRGWPWEELNFHASTPAWWYADGRLSGVEHIKFGVTTSAVHIGATPRADIPSPAEQAAKAIDEVGIRGFVGLGPLDPVLDERTGHLTTPWRSTVYRDGEPVEQPITYEQTIEVTRDVIERLHGTSDGRVHVMLTTPRLCGENPAYRPVPPYAEGEVNAVREKALEVRELADEYDVLIHTHGFRGVFEWAEENLGAEALRRILGSDTIFAHMNGLTDRDIEIMAETDAAAVAVPIGHTDIGPCPIAKLLRNGVRVAIATDGAAPFHQSDLFLDIHRAMVMQQMEHQDRAVLPPGRALRLVTAEAAAVFGMEHEIGSLETGKKADVILIDLEQPHLTPFVDPVNMIAWYVRGNDVDTVLVDGQILMEGRQVLSVDEDEVLHHARREADAAFARFDLEKYLNHGSGYWQGWREDPGG